MEELAATPFPFSMQLDESTDISQCSLLLVFISILRAPFGNYKSCWRPRNSKQFFCQAKLWLEEKSWNSAWQHIWLCSFDEERSSTRHRDSLLSTSASIGIKDQPSCKKCCIPPWRWLTSSKPGPWITAFSRNGSLIWSSSILIQKFVVFQRTNRHVLVWTSGRSFTCWREKESPLS